MMMIRMISLTAIIVLSGGLISFAAAQQPQRASPTYPPPSPQEPPPLYDLPRQQPPLNEGMPLYTQPESGEPDPITPPRTMSYPVSPTPSEPDLPEDSGPDWQPQDSLVQVQENQGIRYVSGGVGEGERAELSALSDQFNLRLLFAMQGSGNYLADVQVNIMNQRGNSILDVPSQGPWFFAQLPPGAYNVEVSVLNQTQRQTVRIRDSRQSRLNFYWR